MWGGFLRVFVGVWAGLNAVDDLSVLFRLGRLGMALLPGSASPSTMCDICDDVMVDLLKGAEGLQTLPCSWACLGVPECISMCENVKGHAQNSSRFPCVAGGYCEADKADDWDVQCHMAPVFRCVPSRLCTRRRHGFSFSCVLKPGYGRWVGMQQAVSEHAGALAAALWEAPRCNEVGAGPYCIAKPRGIGALAETAGKLLSLGYGMLRTVHALETPGGDDDRQWLTFWVIVALLSVLESFTAVLLTAVPHYYEAKLVFLVWLMFGSGAERLYRRVRRWMLILEERCRAVPLLHRLLGDDRADAMVLAELKALPEQLVAQAVAVARANEEAVLDEADGSVEKAALHERDARLPPKILRQSTPDMLVSRPLVDASTLDKALTSVRRMHAEGKGAAELKEEEHRLPLIEPSAMDTSFNQSTVNTPNEEVLRLTYQYLMTSEGASALDQLELPEAERSALMQRAAEDASFQPRFLHVFLIGTPAGPEGELPPMDSRGTADTYCVCRLEDALGGRLGGPLGGVRSRVAYRTTRPAWNEGLELPLAGGYIGADGIFRNAAASTTKLLIEVYDDNLGVWGMVLRTLQLLATSLAVALVVAYAGGVMDEWGEARMRLVYAAVGAVGVMLLPLTVAHHFLDADDEMVGRTAPVPLDMLMDQRTYGLDLWLKDGRRPNPLGTGGGLRVSLALSER